MSIATTDEVHLRRALQLAEDAIALASPNPTVGCVLALDSHVLGEGAHRYDNFDHAEIAALKQAALKVPELKQSALKGTGFSPSIAGPAEEGALAPEGIVRGATAFVTLEPCAHHGRTPPCSSALISAGIARCVIATVDPNPLVRGQGIARLRAAGIVVEIIAPTSPLAQRARFLNDAFAFSIQHRRPFVTLKVAVSADGFLAPLPSARTAAAPHWLTGPAARADVQHLRHASDAILTGIGTVLADNPALTDRTGLPRRRPLLRVILDPDLRIPLASALVISAAQDVLIFCSANAPVDREAALHAAGAEVIRLAGDSRALDLAAILATLAVRGILSVLVEAGPTLNAAFLNASLADKLVLYTAPATLGPNALPFATGLASPHSLEPQLTRISHTTFPNGNSADTRLTGYLHNPWAEISPAGV